MKKILLAVLLAASFTGKAQELKFDEKAGYQYVSIEPRTSITGEVATRLKVKIIGDDLRSEAQYFWELLTEEGEVVKTGNYTMTGEDYDNWDANNQEYSYIIIAQKAFKRPLKIAE